MKEYSIIIPTYQGASRVVRLVQSICSSAATLGLKDELEIVVVIDGSTDDTHAQLSAIQSGLHLQIIEQQNAGLAQTRNRGVVAATGKLLWHLDDDMEIDSTCMTQHLLRARLQDEIRMGSLKNKGEPSLLFEHVCGFYTQRHNRLKADTASVEPLDFTCSNTSGPAQLFRDFPFEAAFRGYGMEDYELATRFCANGVSIIYEPLALVVHHYDHTFIEFCKSMCEEGFNRVQLYQLHPHLYKHLFSSSNSRLVSLLRRRAFSGDRRLLAAVHASLRYAASSRYSSNQLFPTMVKRKLFHYAIASARYAGIAEACAVRPITNIPRTC